MKKVIGIVLVGLFLIIQGGPSMAADTQSFQLSANIPLASSVGFTVSKVTGTVWSPVTGTDLSFDPMEYKTGTINNNINIWLPDHYFAIDVAPLNGVGSADVTATYVEGNNPNAATTGHGLGWKATATFIKVTGSGTSTTDNPLDSHGPKKMLKDLVSGENISHTETAGGWLRIYVGIVSKDTAATYPDPTDSETFTNSDTHGPYEGTLTLSATVQG